MLATSVKLPESNGTNTTPAAVRAAIVALIAAWICIVRRRCHATVLPAFHIFCIDKCTACRTLGSGKCSSKNSEGSLSCAGADRLGKISQPLFICMTTTCVPLKLNACPQREHPAGLTTTQAKLLPHFRRLQSTDISVSSKGKHHLSTEACFPPEGAGQANACPI